MADIRIGKISSIDYRTGMAKVVYADRDSVVTKELPYLSMNREFSPPEPGDKVLVAYLSNGDSAAVILGTIFNKETPADGKKGSYKKKINEKVSIEYDPSLEQLVIKAPNIRFETDSQTVEW